VTWFLFQGTIIFAVIATEIQLGWAGHIMVISGGGVPRG